MAFLDKAGLERLWEHIVSLVGTKVEKVEGKGLSTEDFTTEEKIKLADIEEGATRYVHPVSEVEAGAYKIVTVDEQGHVIGGSNPTTIEEYGITDAVTKAELNEYATTVYVDEQINTHEHSWNDLTDRPFGETIGMVEIVPEQTLAPGRLFGGDAFGNRVDNAIPGVLDAEYVVTFNGVKYTPKNHELGGSVRCGNASLVGAGDDTGEPFYVWFPTEGDTETLIIVPLGTESYTISVATEQEVVKTIDYKYMPEGYPKIHKQTVTVIPEQNVAVEDWGGGSVDVLNSPWNLSVGDKYTVTVDGIAYECTAWFYEDWYAIMLGNGNLLGEDGAQGLGDDVPFAIEGYEDDTYCYFYAEPGNHLVSVNGPAIIIEKIDSKFLPESHQNFYLDEGPKSITEMEEFFYNQYIPEGSTIFWGWLEMHNVELSYSGGSAYLYFDARIGLSSNLYSFKLESDEDNMFLIENAVLVKSGSYTQAPFTIHTDLQLTDYNGNYNHSDLKSLFKVDQDGHVKTIGNFYKLYGEGDSTSLLKSDDYAFTNVVVPEDIEITWDGSTSNRVNFQAMVKGGNNYSFTQSNYYKVSDDTPSAAELSNATYEVINYMTGEVIVDNFSISGDFHSNALGTIYSVPSHTYASYIIVAKEPGSISTGTSDYLASVPEPGIYFLRHTGQGAYIGKFNYTKQKKVATTDEFILSSPDSNKFTVTIDDEGEIVVANQSNSADTAILATQQYVDTALSGIDSTTSWNDLTDRPFYTESATLLQENSLAVKKETYYNYYSYEYEGEAVPFIPVAGTTYTIVFNGTTYTCVGKLSGDNPYIGNDVKNNVFVSGQEPFQIYYSHYWNSLTISTKALGPHSITVTANEIHKIEEKYLPDNLARTDVAQEMTAENTFTVSPIIPAPTEGDHAANKDYVDAQINTSVAAAIDGKLMMVEYTPYSNGTSELSHTFEEIYDAAIANKIIVFRRAGGWQHYIMTEYSTHAVHFSLVSSADANLGAPIMACVVIDENNTVTESTYSTVRLSRNIGVLPGQTIKVKSLINGLPAEWEAVDLLSADHTHDAEDITDGVLSVAQGGTGQTSIVDTVYTAPRYRASALVSTETTPTSNGVITWTYE